LRGIERKGRVGRGGKVGREEEGGGARAAPAIESY